MGRPIGWPKKGLCGYPLTSKLNLFVIPPVKLYTKALFSTLLEKCGWTLADSHGRVLKNKLSAVLVIVH